MFRENDYDFVYRRHMEEAVIDAVLKCMKNGGHMTYDEAMKIADTVPTQMKWIPCSERLPEEEVLCCDTRGEMIIGYPYPDEESNTGYGAVLDDVVMIDCIAWMPLPEPYKGGEQNG